jgi:hypothetical protein
MTCWINISGKNCEVFHSRERWCLDGLCFPRFPLTADLSLNNVDQDIDISHHNTLMIRAYLMYMQVLCEKANESPTWYARKLIFKIIKIIVWLLNMLACSLNFIYSVLGHHRFHVLLKYVMVFECFEVGWYQSSILLHSNLDIFSSLSGMLWIFARKLWGRHLDLIPGLPSGP